MILLFGLLAAIGVDHPAQAAPTAGIFAGAWQAEDPPLNQLFLPIIRHQPITWPNPISAATWLGPEGGSVVALVVDPKNPNILYAGTWGSGVYKSTNGGASWVWSGVGLGHRFIDSMAISPSATNVLYAGTHGAGVYKSVDSGASWFPANSAMPTGTIVYTLAVNPGNENLVYAGTRQEYGGGPPWIGKVYKTTNAGADWNVVLANVGGSGQQDWVYSIAVNPNSPNVVLAAAHEYGPYLSTDYGNTWRSAASGITDKSGRSLAFDPRNNTVYYATWHGDGVYRSDDNGLNWNKVNKGLGFIKVYPNALSIARSQPDTLYAGSFIDPSAGGTHGIMRTTDRGANWRSAGLAIERIYSVAAAPDQASTLYASPVGRGVYKSTDAGQNWTPAMKGLVVRNVSSLAFLPNQVMFAGTKGHGLFVSTDLGQSWSDYNLKIPSRDINQVLAQPGNDLVLYALTQSDGLYRNDLKTSNGWQPVGVALAVGQAGQPVHKPEPAGPSMLVEPWQEMERLETGTLPAPEPNLLASPALLHMVYAPSDARVAYLATQGAGVSRSLDGGLSWQPAGLAGATIRHLAVHPQQPQTVYAVTAQAGSLQVTSNQGVSWGTLALPDPNLVIYSVAVSPWQDGALWVGTSNGLWRYVYGHWLHVGLAGVPVTAVAASPYTHDLIFAGTNNGAWVTLGGAIWREASASLRGAYVQTIQFNPNQPKSVYFGTPDHGFAVITMPDP